MKTDIQDLKEGVRDARRALDSKCEEAMESLQQMQGFSRVLEAAEQMLDENVRLREDLEELQEQLLEEKDLRTKAEIQLKEMSQLPEKEHVTPEVLSGSELWHKVQQAGLVDADGLPTVSRPEAALLADMLAERLGIANKWKFFEKLWHRNNMRSDYNTALDQRKSLEFQERLKNIIG